MKFLITLAVAGLLFTPGFGRAAQSVPAARIAGPGSAAPTNGVAAELQEVVKGVQEKMQAGKKTEADLAENLKAFDDLLKKHAGEKTDDVAQILYMKAMLYLQVLENSEKGAAIIAQLKKDFPETRMGKNADSILENIKKQEEGRKIRAAFVPGSKFPDFEEKDLDGKPLSLAQYKGKVVLVDFWATWCGPCVGELPNVLKAYEKFHAKGFEIVGISLDQDEKKLRSFIEKEKMPWQQYFDGKGWQSKLAGKYGIQSIPATYLLDAEGKIIDSNLRGEALEKALDKALEKKS